ncbi:FAF2 [Mytilus coruscus]|uniref:FAF2 n=1 Tax=Mytilus coruscus TaxID=42192 RepID=A0A6J8DLV0_MYTCO|nr:FAF2 [Mytilus coruscus]
MAEAPEEISPEQTEKIIQFQDMTGIEDLERCQQILQQHEWNIETAVQDTFNEQEGVPSVYSQPPPEPRTPPVNIQPSDQRVFTVASRRPQGIFQWTYFIMAFPFRFVYTTFTDILTFIWGLFRQDPRRNVVDPVGDVVRFIQTYNDLYGQDHPVFYQGSYSQALNDAKSELRFLLVYLHGDNHQDTPDFCRNTLGNNDVINFINSSMLFWSCDTNSPEGYRDNSPEGYRGPEGYRVSRALRENTYPFLALIVLRQNKMTVVARIEGPIGPVELTQRLERLMNDNETSLVAARADREERSFNQTLRQQQDEAYLESLKADQEKARKRQEEEKEVRQIEQQKEEEELERQRLIQDLYHFAFCNEDCPDDFHIVTNFPRRTLPCEPKDGEPEPPTFAEAGLGKNEMLFVQDNEA